MTLSKSYFICPCRIVSSHSHFA